MTPSSTMLFPPTSPGALADAPPRGIVLARQRLAEAWRAQPSATARQWSALVAELDALLDAPSASSDWLDRLLALRDRALGLAESHTDASLYHLIHTAGHDARRYSSVHALLCLVVARETAQALRFEDALVSSLELAALTMNASVRALQDELALAEVPPSAAMRAVIARHAERSVALLRAAGVLDPLWLDTVRLHHDASRRDLALDALTPAQRAARLLKRVDGFVAKLSRRRSRPPLSPVRAAREACLGAGDMPDEVGAALLGSIGVYPPGSVVTLRSGESGLVVARGLRANLPLVAVLWEADGSPCAAPRLRNAQRYQHAVQSARPRPAPVDAPPHEWLMAHAPAAWSQR